MLSIDSAKYNLQNVSLSSSRILWSSVPAIGGEGLGFLKAFLNFSVRSF
jgi:hypothetical protein